MYEYTTRKIHPKQIESLSNWGYRPHDSNFFDLNGQFFDKINKH